VEKGFIQLRAERGSGSFARIFVEDTGSGIPLEKQSQLFKKFQTSLDLQSQGTGVGLWLSKTLASALNGDLWLDTSFDSGLTGCPGSRFVIHLRDAVLHLDESHPSASDPRGGETLSQSTKRTQPSTTLVDEGSECDAPQPLPENLRVLFVDDDVVVRKMFVRAVRKAQPSWSIQEAASGETALKLCESGVFDLIFLDQVRHIGPGLNHELSR